MFTSYFNETHDEARRNIRRFVERHIQPNINEWEEAGTFPREIFNLAGDAGILGIGYPEEFGGNSEGDYFMSLVATEELLRAGSGGFFLQPDVAWHCTATHCKVGQPRDERTHCSARAAW